MEKREMLAVGIIFVLFALFFIIFYSVSGEYAIALIATALGVAGTAFLYYSGNINEETAILSSVMFIGGGIVIPLISMIKDHAPFLIVLSFGAACALMVLKPPDRNSVRAPVHH